MHVHVLSRIDAERLNFPPASVLISVYDTGSEPLRNATISFCFDDITIPLNFQTLFTRQHGLELLQFVNDSVASGISCFYINCEHGICRSASIGLFLSTVFYQDFETFVETNPGLLPNPYVYEILCRLAEEVGIHREWPSLQFFERMFDIRSSL